MKELKIYIKYWGLGDSLFFSHIPRLAKKNGYDKVSVYLHSDVYNSKKAELIWDLNPYVDKININTLDLDSIHTKAYIKMPLLNAIAHDLNLPYSDVLYEPEVYYKPQKDYSKFDVYDGNYGTGSGIVSTSLLNAHIENKIISNSNFIRLRKLSSRYIDANIISPEIHLNNLSEYFDVVATCRNFFCLVSGGASLRPSFSKPAFVFYGHGQNMHHRHSAINNYIDISPPFTNFAPKIFELGYKVKGKIERKFFPFNPPG